MDIRTQNRMKRERLPVVFCRRGDKTPIKIGEVLFSFLQPLNDEPSGFALDGEIRLKFLDSTDLSP